MRGLIVSLSVIAIIYGIFFCLDDCNSERKKNKYLENIKRLNKEVELFPDDAEAYYYRAIEKRKLDDYPGAVKDFIKAIEIDPAGYKDSGAREVYWIMKWLKDYSGAVSFCTKAIELYPGDPEPYFERALAKMELKNYSSAIEDFTKAIEMSDDNSYYNTYYYRAKAKENLEDYSGAIKDYTMSIERFQHKDSSYLRRGLLKIRLGKNTSGCIDLSKCKRTNSSLANPYLKKHCK